MDFSQLSLHELQSERNARTRLLDRTDYKDNKAFETIVQLLLKHAQPMMDADDYATCMKIIQAKMRPTDTLPVFDQRQRWREDISTINGYIAALKAEGGVVEE